MFHELLGEVLGVHGTSSSVLVQSLRPVRGRRSSSWLLWSSRDPGKVTGQTLGHVVVWLLACIVVSTGVAVEFISSLDVSNILQLGATVGTFEAGDAGRTTCNKMSDYLTVTLSSPPPPPDYLSAGGRLP